MKEASFNVRLVTKSGERFQLQNISGISLSVPITDYARCFDDRKYVFITDSNTRIQRSISDIKSLEIEYVKPEKENKKNDEKQTKEKM